MFILILAIILLFLCVQITIALLVPSYLKEYKQVQAKHAEGTAVKLEDMFIDIKTKRLQWVYIILPVVLGVVGFMFLNNLTGVLIGMAVGVVLPIVVIKQMGLLRRKKFEAQLVDGLMILSGSLKAGLSLTQSLESLVEEMPPPISQEFALLLRENRIGVSLEDCLLHLKKRMPSDSLNLIVTAILVARETGGDLTDTFAQLVYSIREKNKLEGRVKALTVQGKLQGIIMGVLPLVFGTIVFSTNRDFFQIMITDPVGQGMLMYATFSYVLGIFILMKLSRVDI